MRYRAVTNGNIVDDVHESLVAAGIYVAVDEDAEPTSVAKAAEPQTAAVGPMTTADVPPRRRRSPTKA